MKAKTIGASPRKIGELEVANYYKIKIKEHKEEVSFASRLVGVYSYKLAEIRGHENEKLIGKINWACNRS
ncbi:MAG: hypothetical protein U9Q99_00390 [Nanoarchaeota archaeon]|nr:hypothetical protein [Nanoarchaeota archaeon]